MPYQLIDGKKMSAAIKDELKEEISALTSQGKRCPGLAVVLVGDDPASQVYVRNKEKACEAVGIKSIHYTRSAKISQEELITIVDDLNKDDAVDGILVQLPLPAHINKQMIIEAISPQKDVDGFHPENVGRLLANTAELVSCTPAGIIELLDRYEIALEGKHTVVIGRSDIVGKPVAVLLLHRNSTVSICHSRTKNIADFIKKADIVVAAVGRAQFITADMIKEGAVVIDVGINRVDGKLVGDVVFDEVKEKVSFITPVPGGVGPMTIAMLLKNTLIAYKKTHNI